MSVIHECGILEIEVIIRSVVRLKLYESYAIPSPYHRLSFGDPRMVLDLPAQICWQTTEFFSLNKTFIAPVIR